MTSTTNTNATTKINVTSNALRLGLARGWMEFKLYSLSPSSLVWSAIFVIGSLVVLWFQRGSQLGGVSLALLTLPSLLGIQIAFEGFSNVASLLSYDREDGTLLRAKAIPRGMFAYVIARVVLMLLSLLLNVTLLLVPSFFIVRGFETVNAVDVLVFFGVLAFGLLATVPLGAVIGATVKSSGAGFGLTFLPCIVLVAISGIFYPITALPVWVQMIAQLFPVYWLGLGVRSVFSPEVAAALELGGSWRRPETFLILAAWSVVGLSLAPRILRRMARRTSGSEMEAGRRRTVQGG